MKYEINQTPMLQQLMQLESEEERRIFCENYGKRQSLKAEAEYSGSTGLKEPSVMYNANDESTSGASVGDDHAAECFVKVIFGSKWDSIDIDSQIMLKDATTTYERVKGFISDYSMIVAEYAKAYENELKKKIFDDFIVFICSEELTDYSWPFEDVNKEASKYKRRKDYFLSMKQMCGCLKELPHYADVKNSSAQALSKYLKNKGWNLNKLTEEEYTKGSMEYADVYRNRSAHPNPMEEKEVHSCRELTTKYVLHLIECM